MRTYLFLSVALLATAGCGGSRRDQILSALDAVNGAALVVQTTLEQVPKEAQQNAPVLAAYQSLDATYTYLIHGYQLLKHDALTTAENLLACARDQLKRAVTQVKPSGPVYMLNRAFDEIKQLGVGQCLGS